MPNSATTKTFDKKAIKCKLGKEHPEAVSVMRVKTSCEYTKCKDTKKTLPDDRKKRTVICKPHKRDPVKNPMGAQYPGAKNYYLEWEGEGSDTGDVRAGCK